MKVSFIVMTSLCLPVFFYYVVILELKSLHTLPPEKLYPSLHSLSKLVYSECLCLFFYIIFLELKSLYTLPSKNVNVHGELSLNFTLLYIYYALFFMQSSWIRMNIYCLRYFLFNVVLELESLHTLSSIKFLNVHYY